MLRRLISEDVSLLSDLEPRLWPVFADPGQLEQVITNLVLNARDAMPQGGRITIGSSNVVRNEASDGPDYPSRPGHYVLLVVSDDGEGMSPETRARIFEPFYTTKELGRGTGLGLSTVYGIVQQSGGHIAVQSEPGAGSTFRVYLPAVLAAGAPSAASEQAPAYPRGSETVLLVEDNIYVRRLAASWLTEHGYTVLDAGDGDEALRLIDSMQDRRIDLLITDVVMPGMSGGVLAERVAKRRPETLVLYVSGYTDDDIVRHGVSERGLAFLQKPFSPATFLRRTREVLDSTEQPPR
jgi:CheY-like chemotaxis protein